MYNIYIDPRFCKGCGLCLHFCRRGVLNVSANTNQMGYHFVEAVHPEQCVGCRMCASMCGESAITLQKESVG